MYKAKTVPTKISVASYLNAIADETRRKDCKKIAAIMKRATGKPATMWGTAIVGFEKYHYKYASGHEGDSCVVGFSSRKEAITLYLLGVMINPGAKKLMARLGTYKNSKGCVYIKRLSDVSLPVLEELIALSVADTRQRYSGH